MSIGPFWTNDVPNEDVSIEVTLDDYDDATLAQYSSATVTVTDPAGEAVEGFTASLSAPDVLVSWPTTTPFAIGGLYSMQVTLVGTGVRTALAPLVFVAQQIDGWHTISSARQAFGNDFPDDDLQAFTLLEVAKSAVIAFAPVLADDAPVPIGYKQAQLMQARNVLNSVKTDPSTGADGDSFVIRPYPLDNFIKQLLRPRSGVPRFG